MELLDQMTRIPGGDFAQAMDGLDCLVNCGALCLSPLCTRVDACAEELQCILIGHLGPRQSRLARMLDVTGNVIMLVVDQANLFFFQTFII